MTIEDNYYLTQGGVDNVSHDVCGVSLIHKNSQLFTSSDPPASPLTDVFAHLSNLQYLQLDDNRIVSVAAGALRNSHSLAELFLDNNRMTSLAEGLLQRKVHTFLVPG